MFQCFISGVEAKVRQGLSWGAFDWWCHAVL